MKIHSPLFSGSIAQSDQSFANLSGSFTGSFTGSLAGTLDVQEATFQRLEVVDRITVGSDSLTPQSITGSVGISGSLTINEQTVDDIAIIYAIALG